VAVCSSRVECICIGLLQVMQWFVGVARRWWINELAWVASCCCDCLDALWLHALRLHQPTGGDKSWGFMGGCSGLLGVVLALVLELAPACRSTAASASACGRWQRVRVHGRPRFRKAAASAVAQITQAAATSSRSKMLRVRENAAAAAECGCECDGVRGCVAAEDMGGGRCAAGGGVLDACAGWAAGAAAGTADDAGGSVA
jgi:hypothetical protein